MFTELPSDIVYWQSDVLWLGLKFPCDLALICLNITSFISCYSLSQAKWFAFLNDDLFCSYNLFFLKWFIFPLYTLKSHLSFNTWFKGFFICDLFPWPFLKVISHIFCQASYLLFIYLFIYWLIDLFFNHLSIYPFPKVFDIFIYWINRWMVKWGDRGLMWEYEQTVK